MYIHIINNSNTIPWNSLELDIGELFIINTLFIKYSIKTNNKNNSILMLTQNQSIEIYKKNHRYLDISTRIES